MKKNENSPEINKSEKKAVPQKVKKEKAPKAKKEPKKILAKKLPKIYKKSYSQEKFEKKILKKLYIEADKTLIKSIFEESTDKKGNKVLIVPQTKEILKKDAERFKLIAKDINSQKFGIKIVPLFAVICLCVAIGVIVTLFKNVIVKKALTSSMEGIFNAKCDIDNVDFEIFGASLKIDRIQQANKDKPMSNIFEIGKINMDYNLTELLRGKFVVEEIAVTDVALDTERKTSGELLISKESKEVKENKKESSNKMAELTDSAANELKALFESFAPEKMFENLQNELKSPAVAKNISEDVKTKVEKWSKKPEEMKNQVTDLTKSIDSLTKKLNSVDKSQIPALVKQGNEVLNQTNSVLSSFEKTSKEIKTDSQAVQNYGKDLTSAINADKNLVTTKMNQVKSTFSPSGIQKIMNNAIEGLLYKYCGEFYPYVSQITDFAMTSLKNSSSDSKKEEKAKVKEEKSGIKRASGRNVYFKKDSVPKLLIQKLEASGKEYKGSGDLFHGYATDISSNMDQWGKPAVVKADFKIGQNNNNASVVVDARSSSNAPLIQADYSGNGYPINFNAQVFDLTSKSNIQAKMTAKSDGSWTVGGSLLMKVQQMNGMDFEPAQVCKIYKNALSKVSNLDIGFKIGYDKSSGMIVNIENPEKLASQLVTPIVKALEDEIQVIAKESTAKLTKIISEKTGIASDEISKFNLLEKNVSDYQNQMANKQKEFKTLLEKKLKESTQQAVSGTIEKALGGNEAASKAGDLLNGLKKFR